MLDLLLILAILFLALLALTHIRHRFNSVEKVAVSAPIVPYHFPFGFDLLWQVIAV